jgi:hypothetical protein
MAILVTTNDPTPAPAAPVEETKVDQSASASEETLETDENLDASDASEDSEDSTEAEGKESETQESKEDDKPKKKGGFQKRIERLNKQKSEALRELEYWKAEALKSQSPKEEQTTAEKKETPGKPKAEEFETHEEFVEALADWKYEQRKALDEIKQKQVQAKTAFEKSVETFQSKVKEFQKTQKDFDEVLSDVDDIRMSVGVQETLLSSELGPQVMYELAKDRELYEHINALNPLAAARELGRIEARIAQESSKAEPRKQTKAPTPLKPVSGNLSGGTKKSIFDESLSQSDYEKLRREQLRRREA